VISRILFVLIVLVTLITPASAQIRAGACKMNFWSSTGIGLVHTARIIDLGFTEGEFTAHVDTLDDYQDWYAFLDNIPGTFVSFLLPVWTDYMVGTSCLRQRNIPLQGMTYEPVFSLHPEYDLHYPRENKDGNGCVGEKVTSTGAEPDPSDRPVTTNCW
jgi:hypothetical protein